MMRRIPRAPLQRLIAEVGALHDWAQGDIAEICGVSLRTIGRIVQSDAPLMESRTADLIACRLGANPENLWPEWLEVRA
jgi:hypothetical protein